MGAGANSMNEITMYNKALFVKRHDGTGEGHVYKLEPPYQRHTWERIENDPDAPEVEVITQVDYVWVSATQVPFSGTETMIFESKANGEVLNWLEIECIRDEWDHREALRQLGYEVTL